MAAPSISSLSCNGGPQTGGTIVIITGTGFAADGDHEPAVTFGATPAVTANVDSDTQITALSPPGSGIVQIHVTTINGTSAPDPAAQFTFSTATTPPPFVTAVLPPAGPKTGGIEVTIAGSGLLGTTAVVFGTAPAAWIKVIDDTRVIVPCPPFDPSSPTPTVRVIVTTPVGPSSASGTDVFEYLAVPVVTFVSPNIGSPVGGTAVSIAGTGLAAADEVRFGSSPASELVIVDDTRITVASPPGAVGTKAPVTVTSPGGTSAPTPAADYLYSNAGIPVVTGIVPNAGALAGNELVSINGTGFTGVVAVTFGGEPGAELLVGSDVLLTVRTPTASAVGSVDVVVYGAAANSDPSSAAKFTYLAQPVLTGVTPSYCAAAGGDTIHIKGTGFVAGSKVLIGDAVVDPTTVDLGAMDIGFVAPAHAIGKVDVRVQTPGGTSDPTPFAQLTFLAPPSISLLTPSHGPSGTVVTISGTALDTVHTVQFGATSAAFTFDTPTQTLVVTAPGGAGTVDVTLLGYGGTSATGPQSKFTYE